jgi:N-acetylmuramoyl-L-alanine amidase
MSASPTPVQREVPMGGDNGTPPQVGNRALESIARQESMRALLAFSELHEQTRNRRMATGREPDRDLFETERFILDEVLQLICDRAQGITKADSIIVALAERSESKPLELVCRASAGPLHVARGVRLIAESEFLQDGLQSGHILRCDDGETDARVELDFAHHLGARSTVLVPLRGRRQQLGVLQAFSTTARAFTDHDVRTLELLAELVLSALKPEDQDRRMHWLSDVAAEVLQTKANEAAVAPNSAVETSIHALQQQKVEPVKATTAVPAVNPFDAAAAVVAMPKQLPQTEVASLAPPEVVPAAEIHSATVELLVDSATKEAQPDPVIEIALPTEVSTPHNLFSFLAQHSAAATSRPGLNFVMALVAIAGLFSAGAWWGMQNHHNAAANIAVATNEDTGTAPPSVTAPPPPRSEVLVPVAADNLLSPVKLESDSGILTPVTPEKLAALPKITGVRHWSSSLGSTVVIDMEDQVPYEVHRLMSPERIYFDLHDTVLSRGLDGKTMDVGDVALSRVRVAQPVAGLTRIVLDTRDGSNFSVSMESNPYRLVVELRGTDKTLASNAMGSGRTASRPAPTHPPTSANASSTATKAPETEALAARASGELYPAKTGKFRIVLDAGHGGWDLGTVGRQGLLEKDLVLDVTERLGKLLQMRLGSDVMFTRDSDSYLSLDQRADLANQAQADLFVSIHANYSSSAAARGVETYYTNLFAAPGSKEVEKHDDGASAKLTPVSLSAGGLHEKIEESRKLAASVQRSLYATLAASSPDIRNRGIKDSSFVVLTGTTMPSILTEISFVSSPADEHNLQSATYRQQIAEALYQGIARYHQSSPHTRVAQLQTTSVRR